MIFELAIYKSGPLLLFNKVRKGLIVFITPVLYRTKIESYGAVNKVRSVIKGEKIMKGAPYDFSPFPDRP